MADEDRKASGDRTVDPPGGVAAPGGMSLNDLDAAAVEPPRLRSGPDKYDIRQQIGEGGMGTVYLAYDKDLRRHVALKRMRGSSPERGARFLEEAQVMGQLQHPSILPLYEIGLTERGTPYYTMPRVEGDTLRQVIDGLKHNDPKVTSQWSLTRILQVFLQVASAVGYAHAQGVVHRDLKPGNVMLGKHNEVQVLDWGLVKVTGKGSVVTDRSGEGLTLDGHVVGTPAYMSPEQAEGLAVDARSDVYSLGVLLYELLTLTTPFSGQSVEILSAHMKDEPVSPRERAPHRAIPAELERLCLWAMRKKPAERPQSASELASALQGWYEAEADRERRHQRAEERVRAARARYLHFLALGEDAERIEEELKQRRAATPGWKPVAERLPLYELEDRAAAAREELQHCGLEVMNLLSAALEQEGDHAEARKLLADYYHERFRKAEAMGESEPQRFFAEMLARYHDGRYARELKGDGTLSLDSDPPAAELRLYRLVERQRRLVPGEERLLGQTPLGPVPLEMGSYLAILSAPGRRDLRYPIHITRNRAWTGVVKLRREAEIGADLVQIPGGVFLHGGGEDERGAPVARAEIELPEFFLARHPVTMAEYLEFLNDRSWHSLEQAQARSTRRGPDGVSYLSRGADGKLAMPEVDAEGDRWDGRFPVVLVSWYDAVAYCEWRSQREGRRYRLPDELEWEKAARGVDGRLFPWGNRFDPSYCNMRESMRERTLITPVSEFSEDESVYGVRGLAGNAKDWTATAVLEGEGAAAREARVARGGCWFSPMPHCRLLHREVFMPVVVDGGVGLRVACDPPGS